MCSGKFTERLNAFSPGNILNNPGTLINTVRNDQPDAPPPPQRRAAAVDTNANARTARLRAAQLRSGRRSTILTSGLLDEDDDRIRQASLGGV